MFRCLLHHLQGDHLLKNFEPFALLQKTYNFPKQLFYQRTKHYLNSTRKLSVAVVYYQSVQERGLQSDPLEMTHVTPHVQKRRWNCLSSSRRKL